MIMVLRPEPFVDNLCKKSTTNLDELRQRASKFMQMEELRDFRNEVRADGGVEKKKKMKENEGNNIEQLKKDLMDISFHIIHP